jgi:N-acetylglucosamine-6-phosphate deacetylase
MCDDSAIAMLDAAGVIVALGHSDASFEAANHILNAGGRGFTHLFNAMSQISGRLPGMVGAALDNPKAWASIIADGKHVHDANIRHAWRALGPKRLVLVTDAMSQVGSPSPSPFHFSGQKIQVAGLSCIAEDGTLAGSNLNMLAAIQNASDVLNISLSAASRLASSNPARAIGASNRLGALGKGFQADFVVVQNNKVSGTWVNGVRRW